MSMMKWYKLLLITLLVFVPLSGCGTTTSTPTALPTAIPASTIMINFTDTDISKVSIEAVSQPNCGGTADVERSVEKSRSIEHIVELPNGMSTNINGEIGFAGSVIALGVTIASQLGDSYGTVDNIASALTIKARQGTNMQHVIRQVEIWQVGTAIISVGDQQITIPFRYRHDFGIELVGSLDLGGCSTLTPNPSPSASETVATSTQAFVSCSGIGGIELLSVPWYLEGENEDAQTYQEVDPNVLRDKTMISVTYNLHGLEVHEGNRKDESAIIFDQPNWYGVSLANYGQNGLDGEQTVDIPLSDFVGLPDPAGIEGGGLLNLSAPVARLHARFWSSEHFIIEITSIRICAHK